jgi:hypothetical protein
MKDPKSIPGLRFSTACVDHRPCFQGFFLGHERTIQDAIGVVSYGLIFAFIESVLVFLVAVILSFLVSRKWAEERRLALVGILVMITSLWAIAGYLFFILNVSIPGESIVFLAGLTHPLRFLYGLSLALVVPTIVLPAYLALRSEKFVKGVQGLFERLALLTTLYLFFDVIGLFIVIIRNV